VLGFLSYEHVAFRDGGFDSFDLLFGISRFHSQTIANGLRSARSIFRIKKRTLVECVERQRVAV
jgi:hypothetical protein